MQSLIDELRRLFLLPGQQAWVEGSDGRALAPEPLTAALLEQSLTGERSVALDLVGDGDRVRTLTVEFERGDDWPYVERLHRALHAELALPAAAMSVSGRNGYGIWLSLEQPVAAERAVRFLELLRRFCLPERIHEHVQLRPGGGSPALARLPPCRNAGQWAAFIQPSTVGFYNANPGFVSAPNPQQQTKFLTRLKSIPPLAFEQALAALEARIPKPAPAPAEAPPPVRPKRITAKTESGGRAAKRPAATAEPSAAATQEAPATAATPSRNAAGKSAEAARPKAAAAAATPAPAKAAKRPASPPPAPQPAKRAPAALPPQPKRGKQAARPAAPEATSETASPPPAAASAPGQDSVSPAAAPMPEPAPAAPLSEAAAAAPPQPEISPAVARPESEISPEPAAPPAAEAIAASTAPPPAEAAPGTLAADRAALAAALARTAEQEVIPSPFAALDRLLNGGFRGGRLYLMTGGSAGTLAAMSAEQAAAHGHAALHVSWLKGRMELVERSLARRCGIDAGRLAMRQLDAEESARVSAALEGFLAREGRLLEIREAGPATSLAELSEWAAAHAQANAPLLVIEPLSLMRSGLQELDTQSSEPRRLRELAAALKALARATGAAVIAVADTEAEAAGLAADELLRLGEEGSALALATRTGGAALTYEVLGEAAGG